MPITNTQADNAKPQAKTYRLNDGNGLQLEVRATGAKLWMYRYRNPQTKKPTVYTISNCCGGLCCVRYDLDGTENCVIIQPEREHAGSILAAKQKV